jgi:hypothetical protein
MGKNGKIKLQTTVARSIETILCSILSKVLQSLLVEATMYFVIL